MLIWIESYTWSYIPATGDIPRPRVGHKTVKIRDKIYLYGGTCCDPEGNNYEYFDTLHYFDLRIFPHLLLNFRNIKLEINRTRWRETSTITESLTIQG